MKWRSESQDGPLGNGIQSPRSRVILNLDDEDVRGPGKRDPVEADVPSGYEGSEDRSQQRRGAKRQYQRYADRKVFELRHLFR